MKDLLHTTIEEFAADGFTHIECYCPRCREIRLRPISYLPRISRGLTIAQLSTAPVCGVRRTGSFSQTVSASRYVLSGAHCDEGQRASSSVAWWWCLRLCSL